MSGSRPIVLFTDFGNQGPYVGHLHLALNSRAPNSLITDLQHDAPAFRPDLAAFLLSAYLPWTPPDAVILAVVDPGVGTQRAGLVLSLGGRVLVGPDNGLFGPLLARAFRVEKIIWRPDDCSATFHARDWFAPVAAGMATGSHLATETCEPSHCEGFGAPQSCPRIIYCDAYGNLMTGLFARQLKTGFEVWVADQRLPLLRTFAESSVGQAFVFVNAFGLLEIAVNYGSAAALLGLEVGDPITLK